jgi:uncharacterized DUF497 family protein
VEFEWDEKKARANVAKHGVTFHEAASVFGDPLALTFRDPDRATREDRFLHSVSHQRASPRCHSHGTRSVYSNH